MSTPLVNGEIDLNKYQLVVGKYNEINNDAIFVVGNGSSNDRRNIMEVVDGRLRLHTQPDAVTPTFYMDFCENNSAFASIYAEKNGNTYGITISNTNLSSGYSYQTDIRVGDGNAIKLINEQRDARQVLEPLVSRSKLQVNSNSIEIDASNITLTSAGALTLSSSIKTTGITVTNKTPSGEQIGAQYSASPNSGYTYTYSSGSTDWKFPSGDTTSGVNPMSLTLGAGRWLIYGYARLSGLTSGKQYGVCIGYYTGSAWTPYSSSRNFVTVGSTAAIALQALIVVTPTENTTYRVGIYHGGEATIDTAMYIRAIRIC